MAFALIENHVLYYQYIDNNKEVDLILINSLGTSLIIWEKMIPMLSTDFNILLHDKRGHGYSTVSGTETRIDDYADDVIKLMDLCHIEKANILGLSIGGLITYCLATRFANRCLHLIFSNTGARIGSQEFWNDRINKIKEVGMQSMIPGIIQRWVSTTYAQQNPFEVAGYEHMLSKVDVQGYINACHALGKADYRQVSKSITHPSLFIAGSEDLGTPPEFVKQNSDLIPNSKYHLLDGVAHLPCLEAPDKIVSLIKTFVL